VYFYFASSKSRASCSSTVLTATAGVNGKWRNLARTQFRPVKQSGKNCHGWLRSRD